MKKRLPLRKYFRLMSLSIHSLLYILCLYIYIYIYIYCIYIYFFFGRYFHGPNQVLFKETSPRRTQPSCSRLHHKLIY